MMKRTVIPITVIAIDQFSKFLATKNLLLLPGGFFDPMVCNPNIAWSIPIHGAALAIAWPALALVFVFLLAKTNWNVFLLGVFGGALSNAIDRIRLECVMDFINIGRFPTFNIADICITGGIVLFLITRIWKLDTGK